MNHRSLLLHSCWSTIFVWLNSNLCLNSFVSILLKICKIFSFSLTPFPSLLLAQSYFEPAPLSFSALSRPTLQPNSAQYQPPSFRPVAAHSASFLYASLTCWAASSSPPLGRTRAQVGVRPRQPRIRAASRALALGPHAETATPWPI
jgi:hypothetical protein